MQRRKKSKHSVVPEVGVFVPGKLWTDATPIANAETYGDFTIHQPGHGGGMAPRVFGAMLFQLPTARRVDSPVLRTLRRGTLPLAIRDTDKTLSGMLLEN